MVDCPSSKIIAGTAVTILQTGKWTLFFFISRNSKYYIYEKKYKIKKKKNYNKRNNS